MTRMSLDTEAAARSLDHLGISQDVMGTASADLTRVHPGLLPPRVLAHVLAEQARLASGLRAGQAAVLGSRVELANRLSAFVNADGSALSPRARDSIGNVLRPPGGQPFSIDIGPASLLAKQFGHAKRITGVIYGQAQQRLLKSDSVRRYVSQHGLRGVYSRYESFFDNAPARVLGRVNKAFGVVAVVDGYRNAYSASSATAPFGRVSSALLSTGVATVMTRNPLVAGVDLLSGGAVSGAITTTVDEIVVHVSGDTRGQEEFDRAVTTGEKGMLFHGAAAMADVIAGGDTMASDTFTAKANSGEYGPVLKLVGTGGDRLADLLYPTPGAPGGGGGGGSW